MPDLFHFTCAHRAPLIRADGYVRPLAELLDTEPARLVVPWGAFAWFTDLAVPIRDALGLTSSILKCDRTEYRFRVFPPVEVTQWASVRREFPWAWELETADGARPMHWWISADPIPVIEAPRAE